MTSKEIETEQLHLQKQMEILEMQKRRALIEENKAYLCKKCKTFVDKGKEGEVAVGHELCGNCFHKKMYAEREKELISKLKFGRIVDMEIENLDEISQLTVYKSGMVYDLTPEYDRDFDDKPKIVIRHSEKSKDMELDVVEEVKPWQKERMEKPLQE